MAGVEYGEYEGQPEVENGAVVAETEDAWLITDVEQDSDEVRLEEIDNEPGRVRIHTLDDDTIQYTDMTFRDFQLARLAFGLWEKCGPFVQPEGTAIPLEVATEGQSAIAAYLRVGNGYPSSRSSVASRMDISEQTVSNYCNRIRWSP